MYDISHKIIVGYSYLFIDIFSSRSDISKPPMFVYAFTIFDGESETETCRHKN